MAKNAIVFVLAALLGTAVTLGAAPGALASPSEKTYIGLYADLAHTDWCAEEICPGFCPLRLYVWVLPGFRGAQAVEFDIAYPSNVIKSAVTLNCASVDCIRLCLQPCYSYVFLQCQIDWVWALRQDVYVVNSAPGTASIVPPPGLAQIDYASCELGYPVYPMTPMIEFYFNGCGDMAVERTTWGSIKSLYGR